MPCTRGLTGWEPKSCWENQAGFSGDRKPCMTDFPFYVSCRASSPFSNGNHEGWGHLKAFLQQFLSVKKKQERSFFSLAYFSWNRKAANLNVSAIKLRNRPLFKKERTRGLFAHFCLMVRKTAEWTRLWEGWAICRTYGRNIF